MSTDRLCNRRANVARLLNSPTVGPGNLGFVQDAYNVIKPGGWLFLDTPRRDALFYRISEWSYRLSGGANSRLLGSLYSPLPFRHKQMFTLRQLLKLVEKIGFSVVCKHSSFFKPHNKMVLVCRKP